MRLLCLVALLCAPPSPSPGATQPYREKDYRVEHYEAELAPEVATRSLRGNVSIRIVSAVASLPVVALDADGLVIEKATEDGRALGVDIQPGLAMLRLARPARRGEPRTLRIWYHAEPKRGMAFMPDGWWYTAFHTEAWLPCDASPADRSTFTIHWIVPATLDLIGTGEETERHKVAGGLERRTVRLDDPYPAYLIGAVAGPLRTTCADAGTVRICASSDRKTTTDLRPALEAAQGALPTLAKWAGSAVGWPWAVARPGLPQIRTCRFPASGSSDYGFAAVR